MLETGSFGPFFFLFFSARQFSVVLSPVTLVHALDCPLRYCADKISRDLWKLPLNLVLEVSGVKIVTTPTGRTVFVQADRLRLDAANQVHEPVASGDDFQNIYAHPALTCACIPLIHSSRWLFDATH